MNFLSKFSKRSIKLPKSSLKEVPLYLGKGNLALEVVVLQPTSKLSYKEIIGVWKERRGRRAAPVLMVVLYEDEAIVCGTGGAQPPTYHTKDPGRVEKLCEIALGLPDRHAAIRFLSKTMPTLETVIPGLVNEGLLSLHELKHGVPRRKDWKEATRTGKKLLNKANSGDHDLIEDLGFSSTKLDNSTHLLTAGEERTALAVFLQEDESPDASSNRFSNFTPISYALNKADKERLLWVLAITGGWIRLYHTKDIGAGHKGRAERYIECWPQLLLPSESAGLLWLLFSAYALTDRGSINSIIENSKRFTADVADKLRDRIYDTVVPELAMGIATARDLQEPTREELALTYEMALTVLFRLLFIAYAEDHDLLPYQGDAAYRRRSLKQKAIELAGNTAPANNESNEGFDHWEETVRLWRAISRGNKEWGVPAYGGTMFSFDQSDSKVGFELGKIKLSNKVFKEVLRELLLTKTPKGYYEPVDFRNLSVREFGTVYEGLLESELSYAEQNLTLNKKGNYLPTDRKDNIAVSKGKIYLHDQSGTRKTSGSFYTPDFVVEHLLDQTLEPALNGHLEKLSSLDKASRAEQFFAFRVADIAMGSGHFLVAAIDRIEVRLTKWLEENPMPHIAKELANLRSAANKELALLTNQVEIKDRQLLRRIIARRCIYGVDLNPLAVQLARLSIWTHTFVPGLPLSFLDDNLVPGNGIIGVASLDEIRNKFDESKDKLFEVNADNLLGKAKAPLEKLAQLYEVSIGDVKRARILRKQVQQELSKTKALCDLITAQPVAEIDCLKMFHFEDWEKQQVDIEKSESLLLARKMLNPVAAFHFPVAFPEVFLGKNPGFNVILGNPPWEEAMVSRDKFWARYYPGLCALSPREQEIRQGKLGEERPDLVKELNVETRVAESLRHFLGAGDFPGMGTGDPDYYKAFAWRFWRASQENTGYIGVVLPRSTFIAQGSEIFRRTLFEKAKYLDVTILRNSGRWIFNMEARYTITLLAVSKGGSAKEGISIRGPFASRDSFDNYKDAVTKPLSVSEILSWTKTAALPTPPKPELIDESLKVLGQLRKAPNLDLNRASSWRARPECELHATNQKFLMDFTKTCPNGFAKVYKGESFDLWNPDTEKYNAWADPEKVLSWLQQKRLNSYSRVKTSVHSEFSKKHVEDPSTLAAHSARIAFRNITNATNSRTLICALIPPKTFITNAGPFFQFPRGDAKDEAFLLGVLSSIPLDWYARRFVEISANFFIVNNFPIPRPDRRSRLWQRTIELSGRLACPDLRFADWAQKVDVECGDLVPAEKLAKIYELDAVVAHLYGLSESQLVHIYETFHVNWDYQDRLKEVLKYFKSWLVKRRS